MFIDAVDGQLALPSDELILGYPSLRCSPRSSGKLSSSLVSTGVRGAGGLKKVNDELKDVPSDFGGVLIGRDAKPFLCLR